MTKTTINSRLNKTILSAIVAFQNVNPLLCFLTFMTILNFDTKKRIRHDMSETCVQQCANKKL